MKKKEFNSKLKFKKENVSKLNDNELGAIMGGSNIRCTGDLMTCDPCKPSGQILCVPRPKPKTDLIVKK